MRPRSCYVTLPFYGESPMLGDYEYWRLLVVIFGGDSTPPGPSNCGLLVFIMISAESDFKCFDF
jgi:hypothetical protein